MDDEEEQRINQKKIKDSKLIEIDAVLEVSGAICRIVINNTIGSGFFMKLEKSNKPFYCLITCEHLIKEEMINSKNIIEVYYENQKSKLEISLNKDERFIRCYQYINIDATVIEILSRDKVEEKFFLLPNLDYINGYEQFNGHEVYVPQFPGHKNISFSCGNIKFINIYTNEFCHLASTCLGSSGSPIILTGSLFVLGIHKQSKIKNEENYGNFLGPVFNSLKNCTILEDNETTKIEFDNIRGYGRLINKDDGRYYIGEFNKELKKNGKGVIYSKDKKKIYEGNFVNNKYEGKGTLYFKDRYLVGNFNNGVYNGKGTFYSKENNKIISKEDFAIDNFTIYGKQKNDNFNINDYLKEFEESVKKVINIKEKIENEKNNINKSYETIKQEIIKSFELKHEKLIKEEKEIKDKLDNEVTKIKSKLEEYLKSSINVI